MAKVNTNKTVETTASVDAYIATVDKERQPDCKAIVELLQQATGFEPKMWGAAIIGFGSYHYTYDSGREGDAPLVGFSARKNEFVFYIANFEGKEALLQKLGKHKTAKACVYIRKLADVTPKVLQQLAKGSVKHYQALYK